jgi:3D (Asp-Asp-Asp) domain-containing protein
MANPNVAEKALLSTVRNALILLILAAGFTRTAQAQTMKTYQDAKLNIHAESTTKNSALMGTPTLSFASEPATDPAPAKPKTVTAAAPKKVVVNALLTHVAKITAYTSAVEETDDTPFITAMGTQTRDGIVAANFLPFGTKLKIPSLFGDKIFTVEDRMATRFTNYVDVWMETKAEAYRLGVREAEIVILD